MIAQRCRRHTRTPADIPFLSCTCLYPDAYSLRDEHSYRGAVESPTEAYTPTDSYKQEPVEGDDTKRLQQGSNNKPKRNYYYARYVPDQRPMVEFVAGEGHKPRYAPKGDADVSKSHVRKHYKDHNDE